MVFSFRVFKKSSEDGSMTLYLDEVDYVGEGRPICGVISLEPGRCDGGISLIAGLYVAFRYGREEDETLGICFVKELLLDSVFVTPGREALQADNLSSFQKRLIKRLGSNSYAFSLHFPNHSPASVSLLSGENIKSPPGVEYSVRISSSGGLSPAESLLSLPISKSQSPPPPLVLQRAPRPKVFKMKDFLFSTGALSLSASLNKAFYAPGEPLSLSGTLINTTRGSSFGPLSAKVIQLLDLSLSSEGTIRIPLGEPLTLAEGLCPGETRNFAAHLRPSPSQEGPLGSAVADPTKPSTLAPSTVLEENEDPREMFGIRVAYAVALKLPLGGLYGSLEADLSFILLNSPSELNGGQFSDPDAVPMREDHQQQQQPLALPPFYQRSTKDKDV